MTLRLLVLTGVLALFCLPVSAAVFDFESFSLGQTTGPGVIQTVDGINAEFVSPGFSIVTNTTGLTLSPPQFLGLYLGPTGGTVLEIDFGFTMLSDISLGFATRDLTGDPENTSFITLAVFQNTVGSTPVGSATTRGTYMSTTYPQGTLAFTASGVPFNVVTVSLAPGAFADGFFVDNINVTAAALPPDVTTVPEPATFGVIGTALLFMAGAIRRARK